MAAPRRRKLFRRPPASRILNDARRRAPGARAAADDQELARALRAPEQVGEGPGVADVAAVAENYPAALIRMLYLPPPLRHSLKDTFSH